MANLIFDYDGTLHESIRIYKPAFEKAHEYLISKGLATQHMYSEKEISKWLGYTAKKMWDLFAPNLSQSEKDYCSKMIGDEMVRLTYDRKAVLYPMTEDVLTRLKNEGHTLIFLSNCKQSYMEAHKNVFQLQKYFSDFYCSEVFKFIPKYEIFNLIKHNFNGEFIVIGDRYQDIEIANRYNLKSFGCSYGYGNKNELKNATYIINSISELYLQL